MKRSLVWKSGRTLAAGLAVLWLGGCHHGHDDEAAHGHDDGSASGAGGEGPTTQITVWSERHEVFAEHRLVVADVPTRFVTHVTDLKTLEPRREGPVRFQRRLGQEAPLEHLEAAPARAGIYEALLTFPTAGEWSVALVVPTEDGEATIALPSLRVFANAHEAAQAEVPEPPAGLTFLKEQQWKIPTGTEPVRKRKLVEQLRLPALVAARPGTLAHVVPPVAGRLLLPPGRAMPLVGDLVEAGQPLALVQPSFSELAARFVEAEGEVVRARLALEQAELAYQRTARLAQVEAKSGRELEEAEFALKTAQAAHDAALALQGTYRQASAQLGDQAGAGGPPVIELRSPIAGTLIRQSGAAMGEYITPEQAVFTVLEAATVFIEAPVPEGSVRRLGAAPAARYEVPGETGGGVALTGEGRGRLVFLGLQVDRTTRTVPLIYEVPNPDRRLRVGQFVNLSVETDRAEDALAIPDAAIVEEGGRPVAFVQVGGETFEKRDLTLGLRDGNWVQVLAGLTEGERVVSRGAYAVRLASVSSAIPAHGHAH